MARSDYCARATREHLVSAEHICLVDIGMPGHGHMTMLDKNNDKMVQWTIDGLVSKGLQVAERCAAPVRFAKYL